MKSPHERCAIYARTSTTQQDPRNQLHVLREMAEQRGLQVHRVYVDQVSGRKERPNLNKLLDECHRAPPYRTVLVWALDRLARRMMDVLNIVHRLDGLGVSVASHQEPWTASTGPERKIVMAVAGWVLEAEVDRIRERTKAGLERARRRGVRIGRPPAEVDMEKLVALRGQGHSFRSIGRKLGVGASTAHRLFHAHATVDRARLGSPKTHHSNGQLATHDYREFDAAAPSSATDRFGDESPEAAE